MNAIGVANQPPAVLTGAQGCATTGRCSAFSAVGVPGLPVGQGDVNPGLGGASAGHLHGFLALDSSQNLTFIDRERVVFDTTSNATPAIPNPPTVTVTVGAATYASASLAPGAPGFYVLVLDTGSLAERDSATYVGQLAGLVSGSLANTTACQNIDATKFAAVKNQLKAEWGELSQLYNLFITNMRQLYTSDQSSTIYSVANDINTDVQTQGSTQSTGLDVRSIAGDVAWIVGSYLSEGTAAVLVNIAAGGLDLVSDLERAPAGQPTLTDITTSGLTFAHDFNQMMSQTVQGLNAAYSIFATDPSKLALAAANAQDSPGANSDWKWTTTPDTFTLTSNALEPRGRPQRRRQLPVHGRHPAQQLQGRHHLHAVVAAVRQDPAVQRVADRDHGRRRRAVGLRRHGRALPQAGIQQRRTDRPGVVPRRERAAADRRQEHGRHAEPAALRPAVLRAGGLPQRRDDPDRIPGRRRPARLPVALTGVEPALLHGQEPVSGGRAVQAGSG
jgi:hypothetical protein